MSTEQIDNVINNNHINKTRLVAEDNSLILHTDIARALFNGKWRAGHLGLVQFAGITLKIWEAHYADDPYADKCLLKIADEIVITKKRFDSYELALQQQANNLRGFTINLFNHPNPLKHTIKFATPYSYMAAVLVECVDYMNRQMYTLKRIGIIPAGNLKAVDLMREVQAVFKLCLEWKYTGIIRKDIFEKNQKAREVEEMLGEMPLAILNKEIKSDFLSY